MRIMDMITKMNLLYISSTSPQGQQKRIQTLILGFKGFIMLGVLHSQSISYVFMHMKTQKKTHKFIQLPLPGVHCRFTSSRSSLRRLSLRLTVSTRFWNDNSTKKFKIINNTLLHSQGEMSGTLILLCLING